MLQSRLGRRSRFMPNAVFYRNSRRRARPWFRSKRYRKLTIMLDIRPISSLALRRRSRNAQSGSEQRKVNSIGRRAQVDRRGRDGSGLRGEYRLNGLDAVPAPSRPPPWQRPSEASWPTELLPDRSRSRKRSAACLEPGEGLVHVVGSYRHG